MRRTHILSLALAALTPLLGGVGAAATGKQKAPAVWTAGDNRLQIQVRPDGGYTVLRGGVEWLRSAPTALHVGGKWYASAGAGAQSASLPLTRVGAPATIEGKDALGAFTGEQFAWDAGGTPMVTSFRVYPARSAIVFAQSFPNGAEGTVVTDAATIPRPRGDGAHNDNANCTTVVSAFPSFQDTARVESLHTLTYFGMFAVPQRGAGLAKYVGGTLGGVPLAFIDADRSTLVLSPLGHFKSETFTKSSEPLPSALACGIQGEVERIPKGWTQETILTAGTGVRASLHDWGAALLAVGGKSRDVASADPTVANLGYWTDNGAFYYYHTEPGQNYEQTLLDAYADHKAAGIPFRYYQLDSWWYFKGPDSGIDRWEARPDVFPGGMTALDRQMGGTPLVLHNRWWSKSTSYAAKYPFTTDEISAPQGGVAFWNDLLAPARAAGAKVYEQDWLIDEYQKSISMRRDIDAPNLWLRDMATAAKSAGMTIQYCMPLPADLLASTAFPAVTQTRLSLDYHPGENQWDMGGGSLLAWSLGLAPFKDTFWTTEEQPGTGYGPNTREPNTELQTLVSALSAGPVGPGDAIGKTNKALLMRTCRADGVLLKPDRPAMPLDAWYTEGGKRNFTVETQTQIGANRWHYLLACGIGAGATLKPADLGESRDLLVYSPRDGSLLSCTDAQPLAFGVGSDRGNPADRRTVPFSYAVVAPKTADGWALIGETDKFVTVSPQRFREISDDGRRVVVQGAAGERVGLRWNAPAPPRQVTVDGMPVAASGWTFDTAAHLLTVGVTFTPSGVATVQVAK